ncbi:MAG TPA: nicotinate-nucleotide adenylyltransferase [Microthrixaceae bacterium]|nr:nicotinate (nicotinamide) nucleotide adenylyltransferase [Microthrixaceae bacterium]MCB9400461.1 nicotinate (nicotinamide) nucleotide adenylyltransferase [Microthrixaceae bacterium]HNA36441.1 nicotinate-nucleotide adenylyltransferase [Microthrixaceae bacterium]HPG15342.1 nicotinate-nucleotide adenylyltransferase [Microthrixaceae bacterium]
MAAGSAPGAGVGPGRRIGVFGGTFDPPHVGHLVPALFVAEALALDVVLLVVANVPWQKVGSRPISPARDRLDMVRAAVDGVDVLEASDLEIRRGGDTFTVDTIAELRSQGPDDDLVLILGSDAASGLDTWERPDELRRTCRLAVVERPGEPVSVPDGFRHVTVPVPQLDVSSTVLRDRAAAGLSLRYLVPDGAVAILERRRLYR